MGRTYWIVVSALVVSALLVVSILPKKEKASYLPYKWHRSFFFNRADALALTPNGEGFIAYGSDGIYTRGNSLVWHRSDSGMKRCFITSLAADEKGRIYATSGRGIYRSTDKGSHWMLTNTGLPPLAGFDCIVPDSKGNVYVSDQESRIYRSNDGGDHWKTLCTGIFPQKEKPYIYSMTVAGDGTIYVGAGGTGIFCSTDDGAHWKKLMGLHDCRVIKKILALSGNRLLALVGTDMLRSDDNGEHWQKVYVKNSPRSFECRDLASLPNGTILAGTEKGLFFSEDGETWRKIDLARSQNSNFPIVALSTNSSGGILAVSTGVVFYGEPI